MAPRAVRLIVEVLALVEHDVLEELLSREGERVVRDDDVAPLGPPPRGFRGARALVRVVRAADAATAHGAQEIGETAAPGSCRVEGDGRARRIPVEVAFAVAQREERERSPREPGFPALVLLGHRELQSAPAHVVLPTLEHRDLGQRLDPGARERREGARHLAIHRLLLERARVRGDADARAVTVRPEQRGDEVRERLPGAGGRVDEEQLARTEHVADRASDVVLPGADRSSERRRQMDLEDLFERLAIDRIEERRHVALDRHGVEAFPPLCVALASGHDIEVELAGRAAAPVRERERETDDARRAGGVDLERAPGPGVARNRERDRFAREAPEAGEDLRGACTHLLGLELLRGEVRRAGEEESTELGEPEHGRGAGQLVAPAHGVRAPGLELRQVGDDHGPGAEEELELRPERCHGPFGRARAIEPERSAARGIRALRRHADEAIDAGVRPRRPQAADRDSVELEGVPRRGGRDVVFGPLDHRSRD
jgi:hypothetical protein